MSTVLRKSPKRDYSDCLVKSLKEYEQIFNFFYIGLLVISVHEGKVVLLLLAATYFSSLFPYHLSLQWRPHTKALPSPPFYC